VYVRKTYKLVDRRLCAEDNGGGPIVVHVNPTDEERRALVQELGVDEHTLGSALDPDELARVEIEPQHLALIFKRPKNYSDGRQLTFGVASTGVFMFSDALHIVMADEAPLFDGGPPPRATTLPGLMLVLIGRAIVHFREHLRGISRVSDELGGEINRAMENRHLISMFSLQKSLVFYVNAIDSNGALLAKLRNFGPRIGFTTENLELLEDLVIENTQCGRQAEIYSNILASLMDARASIVANNLNVLMKRLNVITIAIMVPTLVVSAFSMNVPIPLQEHGAAFWFVLLLASISAVSFLWLWKRRGG
jgi:magnesium transporter